MSMNHLLITADRATHLKIVVVALVGGMVAVIGGVAGHVAYEQATARALSNQPVAKASRSAVVTSRDHVVVR